MEVGEAESKFEKAKSSTSSMKSRSPILNDDDGGCVGGEEEYVG